MSIKSINIEKDTLVIILNKNKRISKIYIDNFEVLHYNIYQEEKGLKIYIDTKLLFLDSYEQCNFSVEFISDMGFKSTETIRICDTILKKLKKYFYLNFYLDEKYLNINMKIENIIIDKVDIILVISNEYKSYEYKFNYEDDRWFIEISKLKYVENCKLNIYLKIEDKYSLITDKYLYNELRNKNYYNKYIFDGGLYGIEIKNNKINFKKPSSIITVDSVFVYDKFIRIYLNQQKNELYNKFDIILENKSKDIIYKSNINHDSVKGPYIDIFIDHLLKLNVDKEEDIYIYIKDMYTNEKIFLKSYTNKSTSFKYTTLNHNYLKYHPYFTDNNSIRICCKNDNKTDIKTRVSIFDNMNIKTKLKYVTILIYLQCIYFLSFINLNSKFKDIWLIGEMSNTAQDNGYHFFKYIRSEHSDIKCYYIIDKDSPDIKNIINLGNVIYRNSFRHIYLLFKAKYHIGTHDYRHWHYPGNTDIFQKFFEKKMKGKYIQLQHGVIHIKSERGFHFNEYKQYDKIVVSSDYEKKLLVDYFKHPNNNIEVCGLSRFDNLIDTSKLNKKKIITIMPTWRKGLNRNRKQFLQSSYFIHWNKILTDPKIIDYIEDNNIHIQFYLHIKVQHYSGEFKSKSKNIIIIKHGEKNVQDILKDSNVLITDYSSVAMDFAYMYKKVILYQFDYLSYIRSYNVLDWDEYTDRSVGVIIKNHNDLVDEIKKSIENGFELESKYIENISNNFKYRDYKNSERIFNMINKLDMEN